jgi:hypothetical protein
VAAHVDALDREARERERRALDGIRRPQVGEDRAVVIDVGVDVEECDTSVLDGVAERLDQRAITPLADVGNAEEAQKRPTTLPCSSRSIASAAGTFGKPGIVRMSPA